MLGTNDLFVATDLVVKNIDPSQTAISISITLTNGRKIKLPVPVALSQQTSHTDPLDDPVAEDIISILVDAGERQTSMAILSALEQAEKIWGESTVKHKLAEMTKDGRLTNQQRVAPRGYGLPEWS